MAAHDPSGPELAEFLESVRMLMRDYAPNNLLLEDTQFKDEEIVRAIRMAVSEYNSMSPSTRITWRALPEDLLFLGVARWLTLSESFLQIRNQVAVPTDGLGVVGIDDKFQLYQSLTEQLKQEFQQRCRMLKNEMNLASGYGSLRSGYAGVSRFYNN